MLLVIDVGNTNTVLGIYEGERLVDNWRIWTERDRTSDEYGILVRNLFSSRSLSLEKIDAIAISCVVPPMLNMLLELSQKYFQPQAPDRRVRGQYGNARSCRQPDGSGGRPDRQRRRRRTTNTGAA